jgi:hypothetical protein
MTDYPAVLAAIRPGAQWTLDGEDYAGLTWLDDSPKPSTKTLDDAWPQVQYDRAYAEVEAQRRARYQSETDGMFFAAQRDGGDLTEWTAACDQIKAELPYPTAPGGSDA